MSAYIKTLKNTDGDIIYPQTKTSAVYTNDGTNIELILNNLITSSSTPYSADSTYALGTYCNVNGVMYKCTAAITVAEAWNAAHWTETSVAAELLAIIATLAGKVNKLNTISNVSLNTITESGPYRLQGGISDFPPNAMAAQYGQLLVINGGEDTCCQIYSDYDGHKLFYRSATNAIASPVWSEWNPVATATPPEEYDLSLASGWSGGGKYCKDQFGFVHISGSFTVSTAPNGWSTIATLPAGYRPKHDFRYMSVSRASRTPIYVAIYQNGLVQALMPSGEQDVDICADFLSE